VNYNWFKIFNKTEFEELDLTSKTYTQVLTGVGERDILVTQGIGLGVLFDDVFLPVQLNDKNPFEFEDRAVYIDDNDDVWVGIAIED
jgi:hypothetical protein